MRNEQYKLETTEKGITANLFFYTYEDMEKFVCAQCGNFDRLYSADFDVERMLDENGIN